MPRRQFVSDLARAVRFVRANAATYGIDSKDIAVMGFDNVAQSAHTTPPLTTVEVPKSAMGMLAMRRLHELITGTAPDVAVKNVLYTSVVVRASA